MAEQTAKLVETPSPAPWEEAYYEGIDIEIHCADGSVIASLPLNPRSASAQAANARLIAAAPDLYNAIKSSMEYLEEQFGDCAEGCECIMHDLRAALAKAEGR